MGLIGEKLIAAGLDLKESHRQALRITAANWFASGGTLDEWMKIGTEVAAKEKPGGGHRRDVRKDQMSCASARSPAPEGRPDLVRKDHQDDADGRSFASGEAKIDMPEKAKTTLPPARDPVSPLPDGGQLANASDGLLQLASARHPNAGEAARPVPSGHAQCAPSRALNANDGSQDRAAPQGHSSCASVVRIPNKPRSLAELQRTRAIVKPSIFETCSLRGEPLAKMTRGRLKRLRFENLFEASLATLILNYAAAGDDILIPDIIKGEQLSGMILEAQEIANAA
jgi:hypothetical protein